MTKCTEVLQSKIEMYISLGNKIRFAALSLINLAMQV